MSHPNTHGVHALALMLQVAPWVAEQLSSAPELAFLDQVAEVWGVSDTPAHEAANVLGGTKPPGASGLSMTQQVQKLEGFKVSRKIPTRNFSSPAQHAPPGPGHQWAASQVACGCTAWCKCASPVRSRSLLQVHMCIHPVTLMSKCGEIQLL